MLNGTVEIVGMSVHESIACQEKAMRGMLLQSIFTACLLGCVASLGTAWGNPQSTGPRNKERVQQPSDRSSQAGSAPAQSPLVVEVRSLPPRSAEEVIESKLERAEKAASDERLVQFTGALVGATVLLVVATIGLGYFTWRLAKGADQTAMRQLRAYVHFTGSDIELGDKTPPGELDPEKRVFGTISVQFENAGMTPAHGLSIFSWLGSQDAGEPVAQALALTTHKPVQRTVGPDQTWPRPR